VSGGDLLELAKDRLHLLYF